MSVVFKFGVHLRSDGQKITGGVRSIGQKDQLRGVKANTGADRDKPGSWGGRGGCQKKRRSCFKDRWNC